GLLLAARFWPLVTTILAAVALSFFVFLVARNLITGNPSPCFCFGNFLTPVSWKTVVRTVGLAMAGLVLTIAAAGDGIEFQAATTEALQAIAAVAVIGIVAISAPMLDLVRWNSHPLADAGN
ncbi:MAG: MauE/DoxX family redox-associated membrane protein, partial [Gemmatimonadaceae bacterium]